MNIDHDFIKRVYIESNINVLMKLIMESAIPTVYVKTNISQLVQYHLMDTMLTIRTIISEQLQMKFEWKIC